MQGGKAEFSAAFTRGFSVIGELAAQHVNGINSANQDLGLVTYLFGPRFSYRKYRGFTLFGQALIGGVHGFDAYFPNPNGSAVTPDAFAMASRVTWQFVPSRWTISEPNCRTMQATARTAFAWEPASSL
jgi:hypothetical protein